MGRRNETKGERCLKDGGVGRDEREGGLHAARGVDGGDGLHKTALQRVDVGGGGLELRGLADLLGAPLAGAAPAHEREHSHDLRSNRRVGLRVWPPLLSLRLFGWVYLYSGDCLDYGLLLGPVEWAEK